jgi:hypothetical protein
MKKSTLWAGAIGGLALLGCGTAGDPASADLAYVDESSLESRADLYIDSSVSWRPMTADQLGNVENAIPVEVEILGGVAVAWIRHDGATSRTRADIVALYRVYERVDATPILDEIDREEGGPIYVPTERFGGTARPGIENPGGDLGALVTDSGFVLIDWTDISNVPPSQDVELWNELNDAHPGCA